MSRSPKEDCADLLFGLESLHGVCHVSGRLDLPVRLRTATPLRSLLTTRLDLWRGYLLVTLSTSHSETLTSAINASRFRRSLTYPGTRTSSRKALLFRAGLSSTPR